MAEEYLLLVVGLLAPLMIAGGVAMGWMLEPVNRAWLWIKLLRKNKGLVMVAAKGGQLRQYVIDIDKDSAELGDLGAYFLSKEKIYTYRRSIPVAMCVEGDAQPYMLEDAQKGGRGTQESSLDARRLDGFLGHVKLQAEKRAALKNEDTMKLLYIIVLAAGAAAVLGFLSFQNGGAIIEAIHALGAHLTSGGLPGVG
jgi:hypothetical protein